MPVNRLNDLLQRYLNREISGEEREELMLLLQQPDEGGAVKAFLDEVWRQLVVDRSLPADKAEALFQAILAADPVQPAIPLYEQPVRRLFIFKRIAVAAAILVLIATGWWYYDKQSKPVPATTVQNLTNDIPPGKNNAVLILADGHRINLDSTANGELAKQGNSVITKKDGQVLYLKGSGQWAVGSGKKEIPYNTITTARGNQYQLILPDGSSIWLNAESSVRFPVAFTGNERRVEVTGEVYLAVKHNSKMPFKVVANGVEVRDLGTEFNVNSYADELAIQTTVVAGSVEVVKRETANVKIRSVIAIPGQQVNVDEQGLKLEKNADVDAAIAWKNGQFMFAGNSIQSVMRQLERWYDIDVSYAPNVSTEEFVGTITRFSNISAVLKMLEKTGTVHFEVKGRKVLVK